ncbi:MAG: hypothetical protein AB7G06_03950 [Bdellovibrionales bacterium]
MEKHIILYSHGFGVDKTDRGLFTDIAAALPNAEHVMFDYNDVDTKTRNMTINPLSAQAVNLQRRYDDVAAQNPGAVIDLVCHSQGCVAAAKANLNGVRRMVFLTAPSVLSVKDMVDRFGSKAGSSIDLNGMSQLARADGTTTYVPPIYWQELDALEPIKDYTVIAPKNDLTIIQAEEDHVLGRVELTGVPAKVSFMPGDHNFDGAARPALVQRVAEVLRV